MQLLLGTNNLGKVIEIAEILKDLPVFLVTPRDLHITETPAETGQTFAVNAIAKAKFYFDQSKQQNSPRERNGTNARRQALPAWSASAERKDGPWKKNRRLSFHDGLPTVADDSGIIVEALKDELGIHTRRWGAGPEATDSEWIAHFLKRMKEEQNRRAAFVCVLAYVDPLGATYTFEGRCEGIITPALEADYLPGLPISACFQPEGHSHVFSALTVEQKNSTSHRGKAAQKLRDYLAYRLRS
ncbi:MAG: non-canonical purine NTP pyrophosphatase [Candidatus Peribacteraceae bacterium]|nr:non-canonical purine NTP pyrophosphatase [Candidatus Peribacteraceae bacterium]MDD5743059.1 non-canonical purine NTP pyrophosphatase [Candidatus Peribacteraceae bacterium]